LTPPIAAQRESVEPRHEVLVTVLVEAYEGCTALTTLVLGDQLSMIDARAFAMCRSLVVLDLPQNLRSLGDLAFSACTALQRVSFWGGMEVFGVDLFLDVESVGVVEVKSAVPSSYGNSSLDEVINESTEVIGETDELCTWAVVRATNTERESAPSLTASGTREADSSPSESPTGSEWDPSPIGSPFGSKREPSPSKWARAWSSSA
jgi:hypothetical protein